MVYPTHKKAMNDIASWIELTYNHTRLYSALRYHTLNEVGRELLNYKQAAQPTQQPQSEKHPALQRRGG